MLVTFEDLKWSEGRGRSECTNTQCVRACVCAQVYVPCSGRCIRCPALLLAPLGGLHWNWLVANKSHSSSCPSTPNITGTHVATPYIFYRHWAPIHRSSSFFSPDFFSKLTIWLAQKYCLIINKCSYLVWELKVIVTTQGIVLCPCNFLILSIYLIYLIFCPFT